MKTKILESSVNNVILKGLNSIYKGKTVKINFQSFKNNMHLLKLKDYDFEEFEAEIRGFMISDDGSISVLLDIISRLWYTDNQEDYDAGRWFREPLKECLFPLEKVGNKYVCDKIQLAV